MSPMHFVWLLSILGLALSTHGFAIDATGCPQAFGGLCHCGKVSGYQHWFNNDDVFVVNCTNTQFTGKIDNSSTGTILL